MVINLYEINIYIQNKCVILEKKKATLLKEISRYYEKIPGN